LKRTELGLPLTALALSGAAGLVYEVVWSRALAALFGSVLAATGLLLALFMAGLGAGSALGGRVAGRTTRPLALFGAAEVLIGGLALLTPWLFAAIAPAVVRLDTRLPDSLAPLVPAAFSFLVLAPIVVLMGATFPLFLKHVLSVGSERMASGAGLVYGVNTLGAVLGTLAGGLLLLPALGIARSLVAAGLTDIVVGGVCLLLGTRRVGERVAGDLAISAAPSGAAAKKPLMLAFLGGVAALVLEVAWFRALTLVFGSSVYALSLMLAAFLLGITGGSLVVSRRAQLSDAPREALWKAHLLVSLFAGVVTLVVQALPILYIALLKGSGGAFLPVASGTFALVAGALLVPTLFIGAALPLTLHLAGPGAHSAGRVYAASSAGSAAGALLAGFVLVPALGLRGAVGAAALCSAAAGLLALGTRASAESRKTALGILGLTAGFWALWLGGVLPWDWRVLTGGYYAYAHVYSGASAKAAGATSRELVMPDPIPFPGGLSAAETAVAGDLAEAISAAPEGAASGKTDQRLLSWEEGRLADVAVVQDGATRSLLINGKADASNGPADMRTQVLLGHLPVLLAPAEPGGRALVIGLGSGVTAGAVAAWPFERVVAAEIEPAVARAARFFDLENGRVLADPRLSLRIDDARRVLDRGTDPLSVITSEPSNLWMSGVSLLFTREFFALAASRLGERGVLCQWLHLYQVGEDDVRTLVATLLTALPHAAVFADEADLLIVASRSPLVLDPAVWQRRLREHPKAAAFFASARIGSASELAARLLADERGAAAFARGAALHTDDRPILEFSAARRMGADRSAAILSALARAGVEAGPIRLGSSGELR